MLSTFPEIGHRYREGRNIRILLYGHYRIAYLVKPNGDIHVLGVFHGALDEWNYWYGPHVFGELGTRCFR